MTTRITGGRFRNRALAVPAGDAVRPTLGRVRENLFNIVRPRLAAARVLDLYAGSGALGLEALSQGAKHCVFVEQARACRQAIERNIATLKLDTQCELIGSPVARALALLAERGETFHFVFADPPYARGLGAECLGLLANGALIEPGEPAGLVVVQTGRRESLAEAVDALSLARRADYGETSLWFYEPA